MGKNVWIPAIASVCLLAGCAEGEIKTYRVAKEDKPAVPTPSATTAAGHAHGGELPHVHGNTPAGWSPLPPERMRVASFQVRGEDGKLASFALIPLPGTTGIQLQSINLWREELGLAPLTAEQYKAEAQQISAGPLAADFFAMTSASSRPGEDFKRGTLGAIFEREGMLWFAKLTGEADLVAAQKENFQSYLKSLEFHDAGAHGDPHGAATPTARAETPESSDQPVSANAARVPADSSLPRFDAPANWQEKAPSAMVSAAYSVTEANGQADITISKLAGDGGGMVGNVNRWRGQLGLPPQSASEIQGAVSMIAVDGTKNAYIADLTGTNARSGKAARMISAGVPRDGETWFFKIMGDEAVVAKEKDAFMNFVLSAY